MITFISESTRLVSICWALNLVNSVGLSTYKLGMQRNKIKYPENCLKSETHIKLLAHQFKGNRSAIMYFINACISIIFCVKKRDSHVMLIFLKKGCDDVDSLWDIKE